MKDGFGRTIEYLRISVTDACNLRCRYCMPEEGPSGCNCKRNLSADEIVEIASAASRLGMKKLRITGGEPLVRRDIVELTRRLGEIPGVEDMSMTTNGTLLKSLARELFDAGIHRINISLDTLDDEKYRSMTRTGKLADALSGIEAAIEVGMSPVKLNCVLIGGFNSDEVESLARLTQKMPVDVRFIELMPMYDSGDFDSEAFIPCTRVLEKLPQAQELPPDGGVARLYRLPGAKGNIGLISPVSAHFCSSCSRIRLTADGKLIDRKTTYDDYLNSQKEQG